MYVITESEYEEAVTELAALVFDPMHGDNDVSAFSLKFIEEVEETPKHDREALVEEMVVRVKATVDFDHPWADYEEGFGGIDNLPASMCGMIVEHGDHVVPRKFRPDEHSYNARNNVQRQARAVLMGDVYTAAMDSVRAALDERESETPDA